MSMLMGATLAVLLASTPVMGGSLKDIEHVVIFMQENRSWDTVCPRHAVNDPMAYKPSTMAPWPVSAASTIPMSR